ncbi:hypothetical protein [Rhizobium sp. PAMB 3182]
MIPDFARTLLRWLATVCVSVAALLASTWLLLFILHILVPYQAMDLMNATFARSQYALFEGVDQALGLGETFKSESSHRTRIIGSAPETLKCFGVELQQDASESLISDAETFASLGVTGKPVAIRAVRNFDDLYSAVDNQLQSYKDQLEQMRKVGARYTFALIVLGFLMTVVSAINSSEWSKEPGVRSTAIRLAAIALPALITAITATAALFAPNDSISRKSQLVFNLLTLQAEMNAAISALPCPVNETETATFQQSIADWNKRASTVIATAEFQPARDPAGQGQQEIKRVQQVAP